MAPFTLSLMNTHQIDPEATSFTWDISSTEQEIQATGTARLAVAKQVTISRALTQDLNQTRP